MSAHRFTWRPILLSAVVIAVSAVPVAAQAPDSTLAVRRAEAAALFGARLEALGDAQQKIDGDRQRYAAACAHRGTRGRLVRFGAPQHGGGAATVYIENEGTPACRMLAHDINVQSAALKGALSVVEEDARRRGVYPGVMRDLRARYGLSVVSP